MPAEYSSLGSLAGTAGGSAIVGATMGYASKKIAKVIAALVGSQFALLGYLETQGFISVNWDELNAAVDGLVTSGSSSMDSIMNAAFATGSIGAGFTGGFALGFKKA